MRNSFFDQSLDAGAIRRRVQELSTGKVGFYSVGLYPASLAYNCAMQNAKGRLLLAPRPGRDLLCLLYTSPSPRDVEESRMPSSA